MIFLPKNDTLGKTPHNNTTSDERLYGRNHHQSKLSFIFHLDQTNGTCISFIFKCWDGKPQANKANVRDSTGLNAKHELKAQ